MKKKVTSKAVPLQEAVDTLQSFNSACTHNQDSALPRTVQLMRRLLIAETGTEQAEHQELLRAVEVLSSHIPQLFQMKEGTPHQRKLAASALTAIEKYNEITEQIEKLSGTLRMRFASYITGKNVIHSLPRIEFICHRATSVKTSKLVQGLRPVKKREIPHLSRQASELFLMKVISILESHLLLSSSQARQLIGESHITVAIADASNCCTVSCELTLSPESTLRIDGDFIKDPKTGLYSFPATQGFRVRN